MSTTNLFVTFAKGLSPIAILDYRELHCFALYHLQTVNIYVSISFEAHFRTYLSRSLPSSFHNHHLLPSFPTVNAEILVKSLETHPHTHTQR